MILTNQSIYGDNGGQLVVADWNRFDMSRLREDQAIRFHLHSHTLVHAPQRETIEHKPHVKGRPTIRAEGGVKAEANVVDEYFVDTTFVPLVSGGVLVFHKNKVPNKYRRSSLR